MRRLTPREHEIMRLIPMHSTIGQLATLLGISRCTVRKHRANICGKLGLSGTAQLIAYAHGMSPDKVDFRPHRPSHHTAHPT